MVLGAPERLHPLAVAGAGLVDVARDRGAPHEADRSDIRVLQDGIDRDLVAVDDIEDAVRDARLVKQIGHEVGGRWVLLGRLEDERVARREGRREHPHRDHRREIERGDAGHDAKRLADLVDIHAGAHLLAETALEQVRDPGREFEVLDATGDLAQRVRRDLAVLGGQMRRELVTAGVHEVPDPEHDLRALRQRRGTPGRERRLGRGDRGPDLVDRGEIDRLRLRAGGRIEDRAFAPGRPGDDPAIDPVADPGGLRAICRHFVRLCDLCHRFVLVA